MKKYTLFIVLSITALSIISAQADIITPEAYASYYGEAFHGRTTANGEIFDMNAYTAAHKTLPFGTFVEVTNLENGKKVVVRINDRGPFVGNREIDLSKAAAISLDMLSRGVTRVSLRYVKNTNGISHTDTAIQQNHNTLNADIYHQNNFATFNENQGVYTNTPAVQNSQYGQLSSSSQIPAQGYTPPEQINQYNENNNGYYINQELQYQNSYQPMGQTATINNNFTPPKALIYTPANAADTQGPLWRIQLGAFTREENAMRLVIQLRKIGFEPAYEKSETHIRVVLYGIRPIDIETVKSVLDKNHFKDYIIKQEKW